MFIYVYIYLYIYVYVYIYTFVYIYMYIDTYMHVLVNVYCNCKPQFHKESYKSSECKSYVACSNNCHIVCWVRHCMKDQQMQLPLRAGIVDTVQYIDYLLWKCYLLYVISCLVNNNNLLQFFIVQIIWKLLGYCANMFLLSSNIHLQVNLHQIACHNLFQSHY